MSLEDLPEKITKDNLDSLIDRAEVIQGRVLNLKYILFQIFPFTIITTVLWFSSIFLLIWLGLNNYLNFLLIFPSELLPTLFIILLILVFIVIVIPTSIFSLLFFMWLSRKIGYPNHEEKIFSSCFLIAKHLMDNERLEAKKKLGMLNGFLTNFVRDFIFNPRRRMYSPEFNILRCGKEEFGRLLMFSKKNNAKLLMDFGLSFGKNDDPKAYEKLKELIQDIKNYGEPAGRVKRFLGVFDQYPHSLPFFLSLTILLIAIAYFIFTGQRLPFG